MKGRVTATGQSGAGPGVATKVKRILMALGFIFILETIVTKLTLILLFRLMVSADGVSDRSIGGSKKFTSLLQFLQRQKFLGFLRTAFTDMSVCLYVGCVEMSARDCVFAEQFMGRGRLRGVGHVLGVSSSRRVLRTGVHGHRGHVW